MRRLFCMLLMLVLLAAPALAEDVCTVKDASAAGHVTTSASYLKVQCPLPGETPVTLSVQDEWGYLIYQRDYGVCSGTFRSREIHLPLDGESCDYTVILSTDAGDYAFTVTRNRPMLTDSAVYAGGLTLREMHGGSRYKYAVVLDLCALNESAAIAPMIAGDSQIGEVYFSVLDGELTVSAALTVAGQIDKANVYIADEAITARSLGESRFTGIKTRLDRTVDLGDSPYAAVMVQLTVTYDPDKASPFRLDEEALEALEELQENWILMQMTTADEAVG